MIDSQPVPEQRSWIPWIFAYFTKFLKNAELPEKFELTDKRGFELLENCKAARSLPSGQPHL